MSLLTTVELAYYSCVCSLQLSVLLSWLFTMAKPQDRSKVAAKFKCLNLGLSPKVSLNLGRQAEGLTPHCLSLKAHNRDFWAL